ncbi:hypothetical protein GCM10010269_02610 [Streptomyces humidus]|uniref:DUF397 domain-containing protein n=1 Tax=Streptomyces humidus TaxID=52259 RepID=A0A918FQ48_9ACTN|nr:DUF397 domain-containing protein [Streptomyces humidus]GGR67333.1 hypothetical protein GCM10010269_02610 [Streptomyces humidus]
MTSPSTPRWFKSSFSGGSGTECVECARNGSAILVRDSKREDGPSVAVQHQAWRLFVDSLHREGLER